MARMKRRTRSPSPDASRPFKRARTASASPSDASQAGLPMSNHVAAPEAIQPNKKVLPASKPTPDYPQVPPNATSIKAEREATPSIPSVPEDPVETASESSVDTIDYTKAPSPVPLTEYTLPIYKGVTYNPRVPLAIIRLAEANLPFIDFLSALNHLPNLPLRSRLPKLPRHVDFLDAETTHRRRTSDSEIRVLFLPQYYADGRHAIGFYVREANGRMGSALFTPCDDEQLEALGLWAIVGPGGEWEDSEFGAAGGMWFHGDVVEEYEAWKTCWVVVEMEWGIRMRLTTRQVLEDDREVRRMRRLFGGV